MRIAAKVCILCLTVFLVLPVEALAGLKLSGNTAYEALNLVDGDRSVYVISRAVSAEYGPVSAQDVLGFFQVLEKCDLVSLVQR